MPRRQSAASVEDSEGKQVEVANGDATSGPATPSSSAVVCVICKTEVADFELLEHVERHEYELRRRIRRGQEVGWFPWSFSALDTYQSCPAEYAFGLDNRTDSGDAARMGTVIHDAYAALSAGEAPDLGDLPLELETDAQWLLNVFARWAPPDGAEFEAEEFLEWEIRPGLWAQGRCFIDVQYRIDNALWGLDDYKTGRKVDKKGHRLQRKVYALARRERLRQLGLWQPFMAIQTRTIYLKWGRADVDLFTDAELDRFEATLRQVVAQMASDEKFEARPHPDRCRLCDYSTRCEAGRKALTGTGFGLTLPIRMVKKRGQTVVSEERGQLDIDVPEVVEDEATLRQLVVAHTQLSGVTAAIARTLNGALEKRRGRAIAVPEMRGAWANHTNKSKRVTDIDAYLQLVLEKGMSLEEAGITIDYKRARWLIEKDEDLAAVAKETEDRYGRREFRRFNDEEEEEL